jgi:hypothetical protein
LSCIAAGSRTRAAPIALLLQRENPFVGGEQLELWIDVAQDPAGRTWTVEARRPKLGRGSAIVVVRSALGVERHREVLDRDQDVEERVSEIASLIVKDGLP